MKLLYIGIMSGDNGFTKALKNVCDEYAEIPTSEPQLNVEACRVSDSFRPDLVFIQIQATGLQSATLAHLKANGAFIINWSGDVREPLPDFYITMAKDIDVTCFSNMTDVEIMRKFGFKSEFLQIGYDPEIYTPEGDKYNVPEIVFMGNNCGGFPLSQFRRDMVSYLQAVYGNRFGVFGSGWEPCVGNFMGDQLGEASVYRGAKIAINLSHFDYKRYSSDRLFRALGSGVMVLSKGFPDCEEDFGNGLELLFWKDLDDLKTKIDWLLLPENEYTRNLISEYGQVDALSRFTFKNMAENIIYIWKNHV